MCLQQVADLAEQRITNALGIVSWAQLVQTIGMSLHIEKQNSRMSDEGRTLCHRITSLHKLLLKSCVRRWSRCVGSTHYLSAAAAHPFGVMSRAQIAPLL